PSTSKDNGTQPITLNENNPTTKPLNSQEDLLKKPELENETTKDATNLSPLEQANAEKHELTLKTMQKMHKTKHKTKL
ncbi:DUF3519 domain-containing protein, partial [Helicobacter pylori]